MSTRRVLNLGAGVQSTTLDILADEGFIEPFEYEIFADTGEEPAAVYHHLAWLCTRKRKRNTQIFVRSRGRLGDDLMRGVNSRGSSGKKARFAAIPGFTLSETDGSHGRTKRQCSKEYKIEVIERAIREEILGLRPRQRLPKTHGIEQIFGISLDEKSRATAIWERHHIGTWAERKRRDGSTYMRLYRNPYPPSFPLIEMGWTRANCLEWLEGRVPHTVPRSACVFCPFHTDEEWVRLRAGGNGDWERAVAVDRSLRLPGSVAARDMRHQVFVHSSLVPLDQVVFHPKPDGRKQQLGFGLECLGVCGV